MLSTDELRQLNTDRRQNRDKILAFLGTNPGVPSEYDAILELTRMATAASGYQDPAPSTEQRKSFLKLAVGGAERLMALRPDSATGFYWFAVCRAMELNLLGLFATIFGIWKVRSAAQRAVELDEKENFGGPLRIRGMLAFRLPFFLGGNKKKALADLEKSNSLFPTFRENPLFLGEVQAKVVGTATGLATLERGLALPPTSEPESESRWQKAMQTLIQKLKAGG